MENDLRAVTSFDERQPKIDSTIPIPIQYGVSVVLVAAATFMAFAANRVVPAPGLTLIFVLPVVIAGTAFGLGPSVATTLLGVVAFDFFFTEPFYTLRMSDASEIWSASLLLLTAAIVSTVSWQSRRYATDARRAAVHEEELRRLAHAVIGGASHNQIVDGAATALNRIFGGPSVILARTGEHLRVEALAGGAVVSDEDIRSAEKASESGVPMRANTYPTDQSKYDMWPVAANSKRQYVMGVEFDRTSYERPADADRLVEIVAGYVAASADNCN